LILVDSPVALFSVAFFGLLVLILQLLLAPWAARLGQRSTEAQIGSTAVIQHAIRAYREITVLGRRGVFTTRFQALRWDASKVVADQFVLSQVGQ
jgi:hypothetical protein